MPNPWVICVIWLLISATPARPSAAAAPQPPIDFSRDIKPILSNNCFLCHGPDAEHRKGGDDGLRLDTPEGATQDLGGHQAIAPGKPDQSEMVRRIRSTDPDELMPPRETGKKLSAKEIDLLAEWIRQGGKYVSHWAYTKPTRPALPSVKDPSWSRNAVDQFILARLEREGLRPSPEADRYALIRRLSLDLTGLPPTVTEADAFAKDTDPQAYEKLVDRLLQSEAYGEYWAVLWLDLARYADSAGYADDPPRTIWPYRDYVIRSFNANKRFDQFTIEQIAGDLLPNPTDEQRLATAFHRNTLTNNEGGTNDEEFRNVAIVDRVNTTLAVWMGTTIACAQCHNHKYDPISQEDFFRVFAILNNTEDADRTDESPLLSVYSDQQQRQRAEWQQELSRLNETLRTPTPELLAAQRRWEQSFPTDLRWTTLSPVAVTSLSGMKVETTADGIVRVPTGAKNDSYTIEITPSAETTIRALRVDALSDDALPGKGPGHANGNFVLNRVSAVVAPPQGSTIAGRYVRITLPGKQKFLSLAEVQAYRGSVNIALSGAASQSSTDFDGAPQRAIDGNTDGRYEIARSTTHTQSSDNPWWEVDLKAEQPLDRLVIWNRTDGGVGERLKDYRVTVLNAARQPVWEQTIAVPPNPSSELSLSGRRAIEFAAAVADFTQSGFDAQHVVGAGDPNKGWAVGGQLGRSHALTLIAKSPVTVAAGAKLIVTLEQTSPFANHTLGRFRLSATDDARTQEYSKTPPEVIASLQTPVAMRSASQSQVLTNYYLGIAPERAATRERIAELNKQLAELKPQTAPILRELASGQRRVTKVQHRGNFLDLGKQVAPGTPAAFPPRPTGAPVDRLALARWLVDERNPLTARVIANRYWEQLFGIGIVATSEEFGAQGDAPSHPELLDWLATELVRSDWNPKSFLRLLVTSATYRQSSRVTPELDERDPDNRLLARGPRIRLSAEAVRDQAMFIGGLLSPKLYGPPVKPPQPTSGLSAAFGGGIDWQTSAGEDRYRRAIYTTWRRSNPYPSISTFDAPNREVCTIRRSRTNTPLQALVTLNDPVYVEAAQALARRMMTEGGSTPAERVSLGLRTCLLRPAQPAEVDRLVGLYERSRARFASRPDDAKRMATEPLGPLAPNMDASEAAAWTVVANVLLNLDETLMKR